MKEVLRDSLKPRMTVVFCGTAVGSRSALRRAYYAGIGNAFWKTLYEVGLAPRLFEPEQYRDVAALGIGFTDLAKNISGNDVILRQEHFGIEVLRRKILKFKPAVVAFTSKRAAKEFVERPVEYGLLKEAIASTLLFVLPSPSGTARRWWQIQRWHELAELVRERHRTKRSTLLSQKIIMNDINIPIEWQDGKGVTVEIGYLNRHEQQCCGHCGVLGTDHDQYAYKVECTICGYVYGANGSDMHERRCPECQGGTPGIRYWKSCVK